MKQGVPGVAIRNGGLWALCLSLLGFPTPNPSSRHGPVGGQGPG